MDSESYPAVAVSTVHVAPAFGVIEILVLAVAALLVLYWMHR